MLITLCYLYLWARWGPRSAALIRRTVRRLHRSRCSFTFCRCAATPAPPARQAPPPPTSEEQVCLRIGNKVFFTDETQVPPRAVRLRPGRCFPGAGRAGGAAVPGAASRVTVATASRLPRRGCAVSLPLFPPPPSPGVLDRASRGGRGEGGSGGGGSGRLWAEVAEAGGKGELVVAGLGAAPSLSACGKRGLSVAGWDLGLKNNWCRFPGLSQPCLAWVRLR